MLQTHQLAPLAHTVHTSSAGLRAAVLHTPPPRRATATHHDRVFVPHTAAYILMVISFLQRRPTPILPNLQCPNLMQRYEAQGGSVEPMDGENGLVARFITDASWAQEATVVNDPIVAGCKDCACARVPMSLTLLCP